MQARILPLYAAGMVRSIGTTLVFAYLPIQIYRQTGRSGLLLVSLVMALPAITQFTATQIWGAAIDRLGRQRPFIFIGLLGLAAVHLALFALPSASRTLPIITAGSLIYAALGPATKTLATLRDQTFLEKTGLRTHTLPAYLKWEAIGWCVGGLGSGLLMDLAGLTMRNLLLGNGVLAISVAIWAAFALADEMGFKDSSTAGSLQQTSRGNILTTVVGLYQRPDFRILITILTFTFVARELFFTTYGIYLTQYLGARESLYGFTIAAASLSGAWLYGPASSLVAKWGSLSVLRHAATVYVLGYVVTVLFPHRLVLAVYFSLPLFPFMVMAATVAASEMSSPSERGSGLAVIEGVDLFSVASGAIAAGFVATKWGLPAVPQAALLISAMGLATALVFEHRRAPVSPIVHETK